jgi:hypothetical protein
MVVAETNIRVLGVSYDFFHGRCCSFHGSRCFDLFPYKHSKKPNFGKCKKEFKSGWGPLKVTSALSLDFNASISQDDSIASQDHPIASEDVPIASKDHPSVLV